MYEDSVNVYRDIVNAIRTGEKENGCRNDRIVH